MDLANEIKDLIITSLNLEDVTADEIDNDAPLFGDGLGLDSIDALELGVVLQRQYGISLEGGKPEENKQYFNSVATLAALVEAKRTK